MALISGIIRLEGANPPCSKCGHPDWILEPMSMTFRPLEDGGTIFRSRWECASCGEPVKLVTEGPAAPLHPLQRMSSQPSAFGQSMWRPWE